MCRIAGAINKTISLPKLQKQIAQMCFIQKHGGPDDEGMYTNDEHHLVFGHRRLSLLDLSSAGHQPMHYLDRFTITYNGELYNYKEIKIELQSEGYQFKTNTDTEVILAAFAKWNTEAFKKFNGMFAFVIFDQVQKKIYLVRDASGIKPLYYYLNSDVVYFASEIKALETINELNEVNNDASIYQLAYGYLPEPITSLQHVKPLPKGTWLSVDLNSYTTSLQSFSFYSFSSQIESVEYAKSQINLTLNNAVKTQMVSDAPIGVFLSGGIDSAILAKLANNQEQNKLHTLSVYFNEKKYSEKTYQDLIAKEIDSEHHSILLKENDFLNNFDHVLNSMDMPSCDGINTWFISKYAAEVGLKAVLSGVGADELFGGYPSFARIKTVKQIQKFSKVFNTAITTFAPKKYDRFTYLKMDGIRGVYLFLRGHNTPNQIAKQLGGYEKEVWYTLKTLPTSPTINCGYKNRASWMELNLYMQDQLLRDADVMSMAHGLEIRVPFLDNHLIKAAFSINEKIKFAKKIPKDLLITSFDNILPKQIWNRPKMGFSFPFAEWLKNSNQFHELALSSNKYTQQAYQNFLNNKIHWSKIMSLIVLKNKFSNSNI